MLQRMDFLKKCLSLIIGQPLGQDKAENVNYKLYVYII